LSEGQMSDYKGAAKMIDAFPKAKTLLADKGYDANWFRDALAARKITACIPSRTSRKALIPHDPVLYKKAPQDREYVRQAQGLATNSHTIRPLCSHLLLKHMHRSGRHLLAMI
jgi:transposase